MELKEAIKIMEEHQQWRTGLIEQKSIRPKEITEAINVLLAECKKQPKALKNEI